MFNSKHLRQIIFAMLSFAFLTPMALASNLAAPRVQAYAGYTRFVLDIPKDVTFSLTPLGGTLRLDLQNASTSPGSISLEHNQLSGYSAETNADTNSTRFVLVTPEGVSERSGYRVSTFAAAPGKTGLRLVIDISGAFSDVAPLGPTPEWVWHDAVAGPNMFSVVIDAGHGGSDQGAMGEVMEKQLNLAIALRLQERLSQAGVRVIMSRETDTEFSSTKKKDLEARTRLADGTSAFISVHANAITPRLANSTYGLEVYYYSPKRESPLYPDAAPMPTKDFAQNQDVTLNEQIQPIDVNTQTLPAMPDRAELSKGLALSVMSQLLAHTAATGRGVRNSDFYVIKNTTVPAILVETGYVTHPVEGSQFKNPNYLDRVAYGISLGVLQFLDNQSVEN